MDERTIFHRSTDKECQQHYKLGRTLGQGSFATVKLAVEISTKKQWAVKVIKRDALTAQDSDALESEMLILQKLHHPHIVKTHEIFDSPHFCYIIMECMSGGELFDRIINKEFFSEAEARQAALQILDALDYCHDHRVIHRDLKPENLLYSSPDDDAVLKLADFGLAHICKPHEVLHSQCGTPGYVAPEVLNQAGYDTHADLWSVGVIIYIMICGFPPFYSDDSDELFALIQEAQYEFISPYWDDVGPVVKDLISKLLIIDPSKRLTAKEALQHPWIASEGTHSHKNMVSTKTQLKKYNARRRFRGAIRAVQMSNALMRLRELHAAETTETAVTAGNPE